MTKEEAKLHMIIRKQELERSVAAGLLAEDIEAFDVVIRSLEAWDAVLADIREIENRPNYMSHSSHYWQGFHEVEDIIKEHLQEVEE